LNKFICFLLSPPQARENYILEHFNSIFTYENVSFPKGNEVGNPKIFWPSDVEKQGGSFYLDLKMAAFGSDLL